MMPVVRTSDATFANLKTLSTWLGTDTPSKTIDKLVSDAMQNLDLEAEGSVEAEGIQPLMFDAPPGLTHTKIDRATVDDEDVPNAKWATVLLATVAAISALGFRGQRLVSVLSIPATVDERSDQGFRYYSDLGISIQGQSAQDAASEIDRLCHVFGLRVRIEFHWRLKDGAQHPGRYAILELGQK